MGNILTIDRGNTTTKLAVWRGGEPTLTSTGVGMSVDDIAAFAVNAGADKAIICSVAGMIAGLKSALAKEGISLVNLRHDTPMPLAVDYLTPETLGLDRVAAAVGAASLYGGRDLLVVDIGTAVTYDRVTADGRFIGGNIAPGIGMRLRALHAFTSKLPAVVSLGELPLWGNSTETAMRSGAVNGVVGEIEWYRSQLPDGAVTVVSGGWGADIVSRLSPGAEYSSMLVNRGLYHIYLHNESFHTFT